jgi:hypothetical protein
MSHWLIALMNNGMYEGKQVLPAKVINATLEPAIALPNTGAQVRGWWEVLNQAYGMGRWTASYRGRLIAFHGGDLAGISFSNLLHAERTHRCDRLRHRQPHGASLQSDQLQRL